MKPLGINSNLLGYIGIDTIIEQMRKKTMKTGFDFNVMVVGRKGVELRVLWGGMVMKAELKWKGHRLV